MARVITVCGCEMLHAPLAVKCCMPLSRTSPERHPRYLLLDFIWADWATLYGLIGPDSRAANTHGRQGTCLQVEAFDQGRVVGTRRSVMGQPCEQLHLEFGRVGLERLPNESSNGGNQMRAFK